VKNLSKFVWPLLLAMLAVGCAGVVVTTEPEPPGPTPTPGYPLLDDFVQLQSQVGENTNAIEAQEEELLDLQFVVDDLDSDSVGDGAFAFSSSSWYDNLKVLGRADETLLSITQYSTQTNNTVVIEQSDGTNNLAIGNTSAVYSITVDVNGNELTLDADADTSITADTDDQVDFEIAGQDTVSFTQQSANFLMPLYGRQETEENTANKTVTIYDTGTLFNNKGATGQITYTLPAAVSDVWYCFYVYAAQTVLVNPDDADQIYHLTNAAGDAITNTTAGDSLCLHAVDATGWIPMQENGTWNDAD